ncbi:Crp/Fnr family transcriptional regulator [Oceanibaculum pacificum]|uniref:Cyclic nucleotide-binding domain-containing protein n=1 Tax=Oceanibaculum pacificum TaxID=580166 RepID=A0A154WFP8_9PROT|nr:cyclic nucleotide-binding domain-containing protein [Oceanibaculum pacificum]KZD12351.1 hypothetical protein AUP43_16710 [Oceanibaculum pacificum]
MEAFEGHHFSAGTIILHQGARAEAAYLVEKGSVEVVQTVSGRELTIARLGPGAIFGEMALLEGRLHGSSVRAVEDCVCAVVPEKLFWRLLEEANPFIRAMLTQLSRSLARTTRQTADLQAMLGMGRAEE